MTREERKEQARRICRRITAQVSGFAPEGLGHWDPAWEMVEEPSGRLLDALAEWMDGDTPETREAVEIAAGELILAWRNAADAYRVQTGFPAREVAGAA